MDYKIGISTVLKGKLEADTARWREDTLLRLYPKAVPLWKKTPETLQAARCMQVDDFLASDCTHLFLLDSDCIPQPYTLERLVAYDLPLVAAPHPAIKGDELGVMVLDRDPAGNGYVQHRPFGLSAGLQGPNVVVGCAGMLIKREVFETIGQPWFRCVYDEETGKLLKTEDFDLCDRAHAVGIPVWADCGLRQQHEVSVRI